MRTVLALLALALVGCVTGSAQRVTGPEPSLAYFSVTCSGNPDKCYETANKACRGPYQIVTSSGGVARETSRVDNWSGDSGFDGQLLITCGKAPASSASPAVTASK